MSKPTIAIFGLSGFLGRFTLEAFESHIFNDKFQFPIKALTRKEKKSTDKVSYITADIYDVGKTAKEIEGVDVVISLVGPDTKIFAAIEAIIKIVRPKLYIPSQFGTECDAVDKYAPGFLAVKTQHSKNVRQMNIKVVDIITSLFAVPGSFLYEIVEHVGIDKVTKTVTYRGEPTSKFAVSTLRDVGKTIAAVASTPISSLPDKVRVFSEIVTYEDVVEHYENTHNIKLKVKNVTASEAKKEFQDQMSRGFNPNNFLSYLNAIIAQGVDAGLLFSKDEKELINPHQSLWKWDHSVFV